MKKFYSLGKTSNWPVVLQQLIKCLNLDIETREIQKKK